MMTDQNKSQNLHKQRPFAPLFHALRREADDEHVLEMVEALKAQGHSTDTIIANVVKKIGAPAGIRVQKIASRRAQYMATGTWKRYKKSRTRWFRVWMRDIQDSFGDAMERFRRAT